MNITGRKAKFVEEYLLDHNGSRAARDAGYAVSGARVTAHRLLTNANVKAAIASKTQELAQNYELTKQKVITEIYTAIQVAKSVSDANAMIKGWVQVAKLMSFYDVEEIHLSINDDGKALKAKLEQLSDDELIAIAKQN